MQRPKLPATTHILQDAAGNHHRKPELQIIDLHMLLHLNKCLCGPTLQLNEGKLNIHPHWWSCEITFRHLLQQLEDRTLPDERPRSEEVDGRRERPGGHLSLLPATQPAVQLLLGRRQRHPAARLPGRLLPRQQVPPSRVRHPIGRPYEPQEDHAGDRVHHVEDSQNVITIPPNESRFWRSCEERIALRDEPWWHLSP